MDSVRRLGEMLARKLSKKRQLELQADVDVVRVLYAAAVERFGQAKVDANLTYLWDLRCIWGMESKLPFRRGTVFQSQDEMLWVARELCGYGVRKNGRS